MSDDCSNIDEEKLKWYKEMAEKQATLVDQVEQTGDRVWKAESPEMAVAFLRNLDVQSTHIRELQVDGKRAFQVPLRLFYRGQTNSTWKPYPTLLREEGQRRIEADRATRIFAAVVDTTFEMLWSADGAQAWPPLLKSAGYAAAQHYRMMTTFLDWTVNPQTAVHFATENSRPVEGQPPGAVFWIDASIAEKFGLTVVLPPPFVQRLYMQRGFFTDLKEDQVEKLENACSRIEFPNHPKETVVAIHPDRSFSNIEISPIDSWFDKLREWSLEKAKNCTEDSYHGLKLSLEFSAKNGTHPELESFADIGPFLGGDLFETAKNYIDQLTLLFKRGGKKCHSPQMMKLLRKGNPEFFEWAQSQGLDFPECTSALLSD